jgi:hypothetical protein
MAVRTIVTMVARARRLSAAEYALAVEALIAMGFMRLLFLTCSFPWAIRRLGLRPSPATVSVARADPAPAAAIAAVQRSILHACRVAPFRAVCLQQAFAALLMLRRRGLSVEVRFGIAHSAGDSFTAHAWAMCGGVAVTGGGAARQATPVAVFTR